MRSSIAIDSSIASEKLDETLCVEVAGFNLRTYPSGDTFGSSLGLLHRLGDRKDHSKVFELTIYGVYEVLCHAHFMSILSFSKFSYAMQPEVVSCIMMA